MSFSRRNLDAHADKLSSLPRRTQRVHQLNETYHRQYNGPNVVGKSNHRQIPNSQANSRQLDTNKYKYSQERQVHCQPAGSDVTKPMLPV